MSKAHWTKRMRERSRVVEDYEASGKSVVQFSEERGISKWQLYSWRRRVNALKAMEGNAPADESMFLPVHAKTVTLSAELELRLRCGRVVKVPSGFVSEDLRRLIEVAESC